MTTTDPPTPAAGLWNAAWDAAQHMAARPGVDAVLITGSIAAGLGNEASDIDLFLIGPDLFEHRRQSALDGARVDLYELSVTELGRLVDAVHAARPEQPLSGSDLALAIRLCCGQTASASAPVRRLLDQLSVEHLKPHVVDRWLAAAFTALEDLAGQRRSGDDDGALFCARAALAAAGKAVAAVQGDLYDGQKWVFKQLDRSAPDGFPSPLFRHLLRADAPLDEIEDFIQSSLIAVATVGLRRGTLEDWPSWTSGPGPLRRTRGVHPRLDGTETVLTVPLHRAVQARPDAALVWGICHGTTRAAAAAAALVLADRVPAYRELTGPRCHDLITKLIGAGLLADGGEGPR